MCMRLSEILGRFRIDNPTTIDCAHRSKIRFDHKSRPQSFSANDGQGGKCGVRSLSTEVENSLTTSWIIEKQPFFIHDQQQRGKLSTISQRSVLSALF